MCSGTKPYSFIMSLTNLVDVLDSLGTMGLLGAVHLKNEVSHLLDLLWEPRIFLEQFILET